jgi:hypothetical protein
VCVLRPFDAGLSLRRKLGGVKLRFGPTSRRGKKPSCCLVPGVGESYIVGEVGSGEFDREEVLGFA